MEARLTDLGELPDGAVVWDVGAFEGGWSADMLARYPTAALLIFEPVRAYAEAVNRRLLSVYQFGLSDHDGEATITVAGDRSSTYEMGYPGTQETIKLRDVSAVLGNQTIQVMKLNVEGAEYPILDRLLETGQIKQIGTLLIQFHTFIPNFGERYLAIRNGLLKTHNLAWRTPFVWERWDLRTS
jgi:FkbM family methyltransferase